jgi:DNA-binding PadR family transcriptional regulator
MAEPIGWRVPFVFPTGTFIRDYLMEHKTASAYEMWKALKAARATYGLTYKKEPIIVCRYESFLRNYIYVLKKLGLIQLVRKEPSERAGAKLPRHYYRITPGRENDPRWRHPQIAYDPRRGLTQHRKAYARAARKRRVAVELRPITREELDRIWATTEAFLREKGYRITRDVMDSVVPEWTSEVALYPTFKERVGYTVRKAAEVAYVYRVARRWMRLEEVPEPIRSEAIRLGRTLEREWLRR